MKIYYLKYQDGNITTEVINDVECNNDSFLYTEHDSDSASYYIRLYFSDAGKVQEYSLGDIRIWVTDEDSLKLAEQNLLVYAKEFHERNVKRLEKELNKEMRLLWLLEEDKTKL